MASSQKTRSQATKDRIQEIRNRVFQEVSDAPDQEIEEIKIEAKDVPTGADLSVVDTAENAVPVQEPITEVSETAATATSSTVEVAEDEPGTENVPDEKLKHQEIQDFEKIKIQIAEEINAEFALLTKQTDEKLSNFETKIPDIEKGSKVRDELLHDIDLMISQKVNEQKNNIDSVIEKLEMSFASANDLVEMQESLEKSLDLGLKSNLAAGDEVSRAVKEEFASLVDNFKASNEQVDKKLKDNTDLLSSVESRVKNSLKAVEEFSNSVREDIDPILNKISISNKKIDTKFQNNTEEFLNLQNAIDHQQKSFAADLNRKLTNTDSKISTLSTDTEKRSSELNSFLIKKNNDLDKAINQKIEYNSDEMEKKLLALEESVNRGINSTTETSKTLKKDLDNRLKDNSGKLENLNVLIQQAIIAFETKLAASNEKTAIENQKNIADRLLSLKRTLEAQQKFFSDSFSEKLKTNNDPIVNELAQLNKKYDTKVSSIEAQQKTLSDSFSEKLKANNDPVVNKLEQLDKKFDTKVGAIEAQQKALPENFSEKLKTNNDSLINELGQLDKKLGTKVSTLEDTVHKGINSATETSEILKKDLDNRLKDNSRKLENLNILIQQANNVFETKLATSNKKITVENQKNIADRLLSLKRTLEAQQKFFSDSFSEKLKTNNDPIVNKLEQLDKKFGTKVTVIEAQQKALPDSFSEKLKTNNDSLINELEQLDKKLGTKVSVIEAQQKALPDSFSEKLKTNNDSLINELGKLDKKLGTKVNSISSSLEKHLSSALTRQEKTIERLMQEIKLLKENFGVEVSEVKSLLERQKTNLFDQIANSSAEFNKKIQSQTEYAESKFGIINQKLIQNAVEVDKTIEIQETNNNKSFNLLKQEFKDQTNEQNIDINRKIDRHVIEFTKFKKDNGVALTSLNGNIEEKLDAVFVTLEENQKTHQNQLDKLQSVVTKNGLKSSENLKQEIDKISSNNHANNNKLSTEFTTLINECKNTISQKTGMLEVESFFKNEMDKKLDIFSNRMGDHFQTIHKNIKTVEEMILKEEDLTELFKNYTLNVSMGD
ncbi:hypothetical protein N9P15_01495 [Planktomarina sp.]|nr:hypothetical protein [Planktomarina sp.]